MVGKTILEREHQAAGLVKSGASLALAFLFSRGVLIYECQKAYVYLGKRGNRYEKEK